MSGAAWRMAWAVASEPREAQEGEDAAGAASAAPARTTAVQRQDESMSRQYKVAVVGATGAVREVMLSVLAEREFPVGEIVALASERSAGGYVAFGDEEVLVHDLASFDPAGRSEELTSELQSLMRTAYAIFCCK